MKDRELKGRIKDRNAMCRGTGCALRVHHTGYHHHPPVSSLDPIDPLRPMFKIISEKRDFKTVRFMAGLGMMDCLNTNLFRQLKFPHLALHFEGSFQ